MTGPSTESNDAQPAPIPADTVRLPIRGFTVERQKAALAAFACWSGVGWALAAAALLYEPAKAVSASEASRKLNPA